MQIDEEKVDNYTLALMYLVMHDKGYGARVWKGFDWDTLDRLHNKGYISDPKTKNKGLDLTKEGELKMKALFEEYFTKP